MTEHLKCDGACEDWGGHHGEVRRVAVHRWGIFNYCEAAISEDRSRGLAVEIFQDDET